MRLTEEREKEIRSRAGPCGFIGKTPIMLDQDLTDLLAEIDTLRIHMAGWKSDARTLKMENDAWKSYAMKLRWALEKISKVAPVDEGGHYTGCATESYEDEECNCGVDIAFAAVNKALTMPMPDSPDPVK